MRTREQILLEWDAIRRSIANGCDNDGPRLWLEGILDEVENQSPSMDDIARMIDDARSAALEEAAKVADASVARLRKMGDNGPAFSVEKVADAIRALKDKT